MAKIIHHAGLGFVIIPKCGGSSIKTAMRDGMGLTPDRGIHVDERLTFTPDTAGLFTVAFIRNPLDRLVSAWANKIHCEQYMQARLKRYGFRLNMPFDEFVRHVEGHCKDAHIRPQSGFLPDSTDLVARFEEMAQMWPEIQSRFPWLPALPHENSTEHAPWQEMYTPETRDIAERIYQQDIELWRSLSA